MPADQALGQLGCRCCADQDLQWPVQRRAEPRSRGEVVLKERPRPGLVQRGGQQGLGQPVHHHAVRPVLVR